MDLFGFLAGNIWSCRRATWFRNQSPCDSFQVYSCFHYLWSFHSWATIPKGNGDEICELSKGTVGRHPCCPCGSITIREPWNRHGRSQHNRSRSHKVWENIRKWECSKVIVYRYMKCKMKYPCVYIIINRHSLRMCKLYSVNACNSSIFKDV